MRKSTNSTTRKKRSSTPGRRSRFPEPWTATKSRSKASRWIPAAFPGQPAASNPSPSPQFHAEPHVVEDSLRSGWFGIQFAVVPSSVNVVADEPAHSRTGYHVTGEMLPRPHSLEDH